MIELQPILKDLLPMLKQTATMATSPTRMVVMECMKLILHEALQLAAERATMYIVKPNGEAYATKYTYNPPDLNDYTIVTIYKDSILDIEKLFV